MSDNDKRAQFIVKLREFADLVEANPLIPTPNHLSGIWAFVEGGTETERFNALHDFADAFGLQVVENEKRGRRAETMLAGIPFIAHAFSDEGSSGTMPRVVTRPVPRIMHYDTGDAESWGYKPGTRKTPCGYEEQCNVTGTVADVTCETCKVEIASWSEASR